MADPPDVLVERIGAVQVITINRPAVKNALNASVARHIAYAVDELARTAALRVGVLTGAGGSFSAGMDLKAYAAGHTPEIDGRGLAGIAAAPAQKPLIAAVEGWALGGGFELTLLCDLVVAAESARFGLPEVSIGLVAGGGGAALLPRRIPPAVALEMLLTGEPIDAKRAYELGLVNRMAPNGDALPEALRLAEVIAEHSPVAVAAARRIARESADWNVADVWDRQRPIVDEVLAGDDARQTVTKFLDRRSRR